MPSFEERKAFNYSQIKKMFDDINQNDPKLVELIKKQYDSVLIDEFMFKLKHLEATLVKEANSQYSDHAYETTKALWRLNLETSLNKEGSIANPQVFQRNLNLFFDKINVPYNEFYSDAVSFIGGMLLIAAVIAGMVALTMVDLVFLAFLPLAARTFGDGVSVMLHPFMRESTPEETITIEAKRLYPFFSNHAEKKQEFRGALPLYEFNITGR